jgi:SAM-dependent methyltransferase
MKPSTAIALAGLLLGAAGCATYPGGADVPFLVTPPEIVDQMLRLAKVGPADTVYDLGSGDGRLVIAAVRDFGARAAIGVEIDPTLVARSREYARRAGVADRVTFIEGLLPGGPRARQRGDALPHARGEHAARPEAPIRATAGHAGGLLRFDMGDRGPRAMIRVDVSGRTTLVYLWVVSER